MAFKTVQSLDADTVVTIGGKDKKTGKPTGPKSLEGFYLGKREVEGGKFGPSTLYFFQTKDGNVGVWGKTNLNNKMQGVELGTMTRVSYVGTTPTKNGDMHTYKVEVDPDNKIEVSGEMNAPSSHEGSDDGGYSDEPSYDDDYPAEPNYEEEQEVEAASVQRPSAERQARVQELLGKKSAKRA